MSLPVTIPELHALILLMQTELSELKDENALLKAENSELRSRLELNSRNSSKPPSSDGYNKKPAFPRKKGGKRGGKEGHKGKTLQQTNTPDIVVEHKIDVCSCGCKLNDIYGKLSYKRQVFDLPEPKLEVTEHRVYHTVCPCCNKTNRGEFPTDVKAHVQYGTGVKAFTTLLNNSYKIPFGKIRQLFLDLYRTPINEATVCSFNEICYDKLAETEEIVKAQILKSEVANSDETGLRVEGKLHWLHNTSTVLFTYLFVHKSRGLKALKSEQSIIQKFTSWLVHDCWSSYFKFLNLKHAVCNAHIIRELQALADKQSKWAKVLKKFLLNLNEMPLEERIVRRADLEARYDKICEVADLLEPQPQKTPGKKGKRKRTKGRNLLIRLTKYKTSVLAFAFNKQVPFTNNLAERDVRPAKLKQKISGCFRTKSGANTYARIEGFISSSRKNQLNIFKELKNTLSNGNNYFTLKYGSAK